jgi:hypothetical protein
MTREDEKLGALLKSGALDPEGLRKLEQSSDGQRVKALLGDEKKLAEAVRRGDAKTLRETMQTLLSTPEGQRLFQTLGGMMGKK